MAERIELTDKIEKITIIFKLFANLQETFLAIEAG